MARLSSRALGSSLLLLPFAGLVFAACGSSTQSTPDTGIGGFGDGGPPKHDATTGKKDTGTTKPDTGTPKLDATADVKEASVGITDGAVGTLCTTSMECASGVCAPTSLMGTVDGALHFDAGDCTAPGANCECFSGTCTDGVRNGHETDVDCGGGTCPACPVGDKCLLGSDCSQGECGAGYAGGKCTGLSPDAGPTDAALGDAGACVCEPPSCSDGVKNQDETDVDCGGTTCAKCPTGKMCKVTGDCTSDVCTSNTCACPAGMTEAPTSTSVPYCIDTYEVTYAQYSVFVGSANTTTIANQPAECQWNTSFVPSNDWPQVGNEAKNPVNNVNWCDALAYCASVQHHLCGAIKTTMSPGGTPIPLASTAIFQDASILAANDPSVDEWYNACSSQGQNTYPYSNMYEGGWCNGIDSPAQQNSGPVEPPFGTANYVVDTGGPTCILQTGCGTDQAGILSTVAQGQTVQCKVLAPTMGAQPGCGTAFAEQGCIGGSSVNIIYDLSGNVAEWENSCDGNTGMNDNCAVRGGSYDSSPGMTSLTCASSSAQPPLARNTQAPDVGFRCCL